MGTRRESKAESVGGDEKETSLDVDEGLVKLEAIVAELDSGRLGLEASIARYAEGIELLKRCNEVLTSHRRRVMELTRDAERALVAFDGDPDAAPGDGGSGGAAKSGGSNSAAGGGASGVGASGTPRR
jgi:exodeoxyribonuclease VII small subunit